MKIRNDKYYTPRNLANKLIVNTINLIGISNISEIIEPSAGNGSFSSLIPPCIAYDIEPEAEGIIQADFLKLDLGYKKGRLFIGNPPFGTRNSLSVKFYNKCVKEGDFIAFIQPISQYNNNLQMYAFDLISSVDLGIVEYSNRKLHCCFNIYARPKNGLNPKPDYTLKDVTIIEHRRGSEREIPKGWDYALCTWGNFSLGKVPEYVGQYALEVYVYVHNKKYLDTIKGILSRDIIKGYVKSISSAKISKGRLYKYLKENIPEIQ